MISKAVTPRDSPSPSDHRHYRQDDKSYQHDPYQSSSIAHLPALDVLQIWVQRPQAIAKCFISDIYRLTALVSPHSEHQTYSTRDVFLLNNHPCRMVDVVGWVAGVDHKETSMVITLDDGDGQHVIPVTVRLSLRPANFSSHSPTIGLTGPTGPTDPHGQAHSISDTSTFTSARERRAQERARGRATLPTQTLPKMYQRKDIHVGDTVRVVGRVDEWARKRAGGELDWVRQLVVEEGSRGSISVLDEEAQYAHVTVVLDLHRSLYSRPFTVPPTNHKSLPPSPVKSQSQSMEPSSELGSEIGIDVACEELRLRDPSKLRSSQLCDSTFRQYLVDYMTQETIQALNRPGDTRQCTSDTLAAVFPEYRDMINKGKRRGPAQTNHVFTPSSKANYTTSQCFPSRKLRSQSQSTTSSPNEPTLSRHPHPLDPFTITSILDVPHLSELAHLVVVSEARKEERRRRRRIRDGTPRPRDIQVEQDRKHRGFDPKDWKLRKDELVSKMEKLVAWVIRGVAEDGGVVHVSTNSANNFTNPVRPTKRKCEKSEQHYGYLPLPSALLLPLLIPIINEEQVMRRGAIMRKSDPRRDNGMTIEMLVMRLQGWGQDGRWERVREWVVKDAVGWGVDKGYLKAHGDGWWAVDGAEG